MTEFHGAGKIAQWLILAAFAKDLGTVSSTHVAACNYNSKESDSFLASVGGRHTDVNTHTNIHI